MPGSFVDPYDVQNPATGDDILAAYGDVLRQDLMFLRGKPRFCVRRGVVQSIPNNAFTPVEYDTVDRDTHVGWSSYKYTIPAGCGGDWQFQTTTKWQTSALGTFRDAQILVNGVLTVDESVQSQTASGYATNNISRLWIGAVAGDEFSVVVKHDNGSNLNVEPNGYAALFFSGWLVGLGDGA